MSYRPLIVVALWLAAFAGGLALDQTVAGHAHDRGWDQKRAWTKGTNRLAEALKLPGSYYVTAGAAAVAWVVHRLRWRAAAVVAAAGAISGLNSVLKWVVGRRRPVTGVPAFDVDPFVGGLPGLFGAEKNLSFPSGHACLAFATAAALGLLWPRWRWAFYAAAAVTAVERMVENAHYLSDCVAAAGLGVLAAHAAHALVGRLTDRKGENLPLRPHAGGSAPGSVGATAPRVVPADLGGAAPTLKAEEERGN
jgi:membrane-associated phospholipid phosphatase